MSVTGHRDVRHPDDFYETPDWCVRVLLPHLQRGDVLEPCCGAGAVAKVIRDVWGQYPKIHGREIDFGRASTARALSYQPLSDVPNYTKLVFDTVLHDDFLSSVAIADGFALPGDEGWKVPLVITNPPFKLAMEFARKSIAVADTVALLLRLNWLASIERSNFHQENPSDLIVLPKRPSFAKFMSCRSSRQGDKTGVDCNWKETASPNAPTPKACPQCGDSQIKVSTTDSAEYGWFIWGPGRGGRIIHPPIQPPAESIAKFEGAASALEELTRDA